MLPKCEGRPAVWLMRQAGRYLPEYQKLKNNRSLFDLFHDEALIVEVTRQPVDILSVDAAILFSDILTVLDGLGIPYDFQPGPKVFFKGIEKKPHAYRHIERAIAQLKRELEVPLIGFAGGPITLMSYILEDFKRVMICDPDRFDALFQEVLAETIRYLQLQDVDCVQIFDSWARQLSPPYFQKYVQEPLAQIVDALSVPVILFCRGAAEELIPCQPAAISVDWTFDMAALRQKIPRTIALQGNLDPTILYGSKETIVNSATALLESMKDDPTYIFNLGHGVLKDTPVENVRTLVQTVQARSALHELSHSS